VPRQIVCDNLKAGVTSASRYEPGINRTYQEMAANYGTAIVPTRVRKPRDKAKVEVAVQVVERWVLAKLRRRRFFSLGELNAAISELIDELNSRTMRRIGSSRRALFEAIERPALQPLSAEPFEYAEWKRCRAGLDYHVEVHGHWYSVPYRLIREVVEAHITDRTMEVFHHGVRLAVHVRSPMRHRHTTVPDHMPSAHRRYADWTPARLRREAAQIGPATTRLVKLILAARPHPEQGCLPRHPPLGTQLRRRACRGCVSARELPSCASDAAITEIPLVWDACLGDGFGSSGHQVHVLRNQSVGSKRRSLSADPRL
jgi:transposase